MGVLGLGYVGLPLALTFVEKGFKVVGFDVDASKVSALSRGESYIRHMDGGRLKAAIATKRLSATADFARLSEPDALLICVPTPLTPQREPDMSYVVSTARQDRGDSPARPARRPGVEHVSGDHGRAPPRDPRDASPSCRPGVLSGLLAGARGSGKQGLRHRHHSEGRRRVRPVSGDLAQLLYDQVIARTVRVSSARAAEATKLLENIFRAVNIALVNELKMVFDRMGIDVWEVLDAASTKPFGFMRFNPGPGWGGHCIPLDPFYLSWKAREYGIAPRFIELAGEVNVEMPAYVVTKLQQALNERGKPVKGSRILVLGLAYKKDIDDPRESPAFEIIERLLHLKADVSYHDPYVPRAPHMRSWPHLPPMTSVALTPETLATSDAVVLVTDHTAVDYDSVARLAPLVIDTRGVYRQPRPNVVKA